MEKLSDSTETSTKTAEKSIRTDHGKIDEQCKEKC